MNEQIISTICIITTLVVSTWAIVVTRIRTRKFISWANEEKARMNAQHELAKEEIDRVRTQLRSRESDQFYLKTGKGEIR